MSSRGGGPERALILVQHWRWLEANGYKQQAASLTRKNYNVIQEYKGERNESKRSN
jgi:hypothetical protein